MTRLPLYKMKDQIKIIKYGSIILFSKQEYARDMSMMDTLQKKFEAKIFFNKEIEVVPLLNESAKPKNIISENYYFWHCDICPQIVGKIGIIDKVQVTQGIPMYAINGIKEKYAWYNEDQIELVVGCSRKDNYL